MMRARSMIGMFLAGSLLATAWMPGPLGSDEYVDDDTGKASGHVGNGKAFFLSTVLPRLAENGCFKCHARGSVRPNVKKYEELIRRLAIGDSAENNAVIYKIANLRSISPEIPNHPGGQNCATIDSEPCKTIRQWWEIEFGQMSTDK